MKLTAFKLLAATAVLAATGVANADSQQVKLDVSPVNSLLKSGEKTTTWIRVGLHGFKLESEKVRPGVNLAIVLDKSGSMNGEKIKRAREAAIDAIRLLRDEDIVSIITYDSTVNVLVPATKLTDKESVIKAINAIRPGGNTALFAGVSKGAAEVRKFLDKERVNRVILLSDGLANVGPSSPGELGNLGKSMLKENISVSTLGLGLGYNEDLMVQLASTSGGNHLFIEDASELADIFRSEFDDVLSVIAQEVDMTVTIPEGIRPVRVLGNEAQINGQKVVTRMAQIYSEQDRHIVIEVELPASEKDTKLELAKVAVTYANMKTHESDKLSGAAKVEFSDDDAKVEGSVNSKVLADVVALVSSEQSKLATKLLDEGNFAGCRQVLKDNVDFLKINALKCPENEVRLQALARQNSFAFEGLKGVESNNAPASNLVRKSFRSYQSEVDSQQRAKSSVAPKSSSSP
ncbi:marine proteobacterial sortase target protein [Fuerstiella marisgermanici]|uniref:Marine proteobacterial sortase target protein n=2 Tax=Fuerstiella marisgermanici TaxID=1891926 RepID=A0A1P8WLU2_9PLAN|nr:marine proteobacterial sortase target protein [Fuerstiella marisgermanici]